ncbi:Uncharacterised protein [Bordetella pertussis]|nr:Uncharacterised protein [Bordetella pertussis]
MTSPICSPTVISGLRADSGSWKIMAMSLPRIDSRVASSCRSRSLPRNRIWPPCGWR